MLFGFVAGVCAGIFVIFTRAALWPPFGWQDSEGFHAGVPGQAGFPDRSEVPAGFR